MRAVAVHGHHLLGLWGRLVLSSLPSASMTHEPAWVKVTVEPEIEHTGALGGSMPNVTWLPDPPPDAVTV